MYDFTNCLTPDEVRTQYRKYAKTAHPDKGGSGEAFRELTNQYESRLEHVKRFQPIPEYYTENGKYSYFRKPCKYVKRCTAYYHFLTAGGGWLLITTKQMNLIYEDNWNV